MREPDTATLDEMQDMANQLRELSEAEQCTYTLRRLAGQAAVAIEMFLEDPGEPRRLSIEKIFARLSKAFEQELREEAT